MLASLLSRRVTTLCHDVSNQAAFDDEVLKAMSVLLASNCDVNILNRHGISVLHKLLLNYDFILGGEQSGVTLDTAPLRAHYQPDAALLVRALRVLFAHNAQPELSTGAGRAPLLLLLQAMHSISPQRLATQGDELLQALELLLQAGARPSAGAHLAVVTSLAQYGQAALRAAQQDDRAVMSNYLHSVLCLLCAHGLDTNRRSAHRRPTIQGGCGNLLVEVVRLVEVVEAPCDLDYLTLWVRTLLQWGADPDIEPYPAETVICHSQSSIFLRSKHTHAVHQFLQQIQDVRLVFEGGHAERLLMLFYNCMDHAALYSCLNTARYVARFDPARVPTAKFLRVIARYAAHPRSLQQEARVAIYRSLGRRLVGRVERLPLPSPMKQYLLEIE